MPDQELTSSMEDYLEAIYMLEKKNRVARITDIADLLKFKKSSVSKALRVLAEKNLINYEPYKFITLKKKGLIRARKIFSKHKVLTQFCEDILLFDSEVSEEIGCRMEHFISCENLQRFQDLMDFFKQNPDFKKKWLKMEKPDIKAC